MVARTATALVHCGNRARPPSTRPWGRSDGATVTYLCRGGAADHAENNSAPGDAPHGPRQRCRLARATPRRLLWRADAGDQRRADVLLDAQAAIDGTRAGGVRVARQDAGAEGIAALARGARHGQAYGGAGVERRRLEAVEPCH